MRKRKWLVPVCAALLFALAAALLLLLPRSPQLSLYDYARSLPDDSYYVDRDGVVWQLTHSGADRRYIKRTEERSGRGFSTHIGTADEELCAWEFALVSGGLLCQDGSFWYTRSASTTRGSALRIKSYLIEAPVQKAVDNDAVSVCFLSIARVGYPNSLSNWPEVSTSCTLPEGVDWETVTARSAVLLEGTWYQTGEEKRMKSPDSLSFMPLPALPRAAGLPNGRIPAGHYRLELYADGEPLCFLPYRVSWEGTVITLTEE